MFRNSRGRLLMGKSSGKNNPDGEPMDSLEETGVRVGLKGGYGFVGMLIMSLN